MSNQEHIGLTSKELADSTAKTDSKKNFSDLLATPFRHGGTLEDLNYLL